MVNNWLRFCVEWVVPGESQDLERAGSPICRGGVDGAVARTILRGSVNIVTASTTCRFHRPSTGNTCTRAITTCADTAAPTACGTSNDHRGEIEAEEPLHDMWIRLTIDEDFMIKDIEAVTEAGPYEACPAIAPNFAKVIGLRIGPGWRQKVRQQLGGTEGCTHLVEMLCAMATVAFQSLYPVLAKKDSLTPRKDRPGFIDSCHAFRSDGPVVKKTWPEFYTGGEN
jgi:hypothetical protein